MALYCHPRQNACARNVYHHYMVILDELCFCYSRASAHRLDAEFETESGRNTTMIRENKTKAKLRRGDTVFGLISLSSDPLLAEWCGLVGFDFYMLDAEHGAVTVSQAEN